MTSAGALECHPAVMPTEAGVHSAVAGADCAANGRDRPINSGDDGVWGT
jgi:hypothetical protein